MHNIIINGIQEFFYFDIWESFLMILLMTIMVDIKISKEQYVFHTIMISILDLLISNINLAIVQQIICILVYAIYFKVIFKLTIKKSLFTTIKVFFIFFILEMIISMFYQYIIKINIVAFHNNLIKFKYMIPFRIIEFILIYIYYKLKSNERR